MLREKLKFIIVEYCSLVNILKNMMFKNRKFLASDIGIFFYTISYLLFLGVTIRIPYLITLQTPYDLELTNNYIQYMNFKNVAIYNDIYEISPYSSHDTVSALEQLSKQKFDMNIDFSKSNYTVRITPQNDGQVLFASNNEIIIFIVLFVLYSVVLLVFLLIIINWKNNLKNINMPILIICGAVYFLTIALIGSVMEKLNIVRIYGFPNGGILKPFISSSDKIEEIEFVDTIDAINKMMSAIVNNRMYSHNFIKHFDISVNEYSMTSNNYWIFFVGLSGLFLNVALILWNIIRRHELNDIKNTYEEIN